MKRREFIHKLGLTIAATAIGTKVINALSELNPVVKTTDGFMNYIPDNAMNYSGVFTYEDFNKHLEEIFKVKEVDYSTNKITISRNLAG